MKVYSSNTDYKYTFPTVTLAYFLRYPNPYAKHVLSTDVLDRYVDPLTKRLHTLRLHLKRSKVPAGILKFLPSGFAGPEGKSQSYILERSVVDVNEGWMETESRNCEWTGVLSVVERQSYLSNGREFGDSPSTKCMTSVTFVSRIGETIRKRRKIRQEARAAAQQAQFEEDEDEEPEQKKGWFASLGQSGVQRAVELVGVNRTKQAVTNGAAGMRAVLERISIGGLRGALEGMAHDRLEMMGGEVDAQPWREVWNNGQTKKDSYNDDDDYFD